MIVADELATLRDYRPDDSRGFSQRRFDAALDRVEAEIARLDAELGRKPEWVTCDYQPEKRENDEGGVPCRRAMSLLVERAEAAEAEIARLERDAEERSAEAYDAGVSCGARAAEAEAEGRAGAIRAPSPQRSGEARDA